VGNFCRRRVNLNSLIPVSGRTCGHASKGRGGPAGGWRDDGGDRQEASDSKEVREEGRERGVLRQFGEGRRKQFANGHSGCDFRRGRRRLPPSSLL